MKYGEWLEIWLENYVKTNVKHKTYKVYFQIIEKRIKPEFGNRELDEIMPIDVQLYITNLLVNGNLITQKGLSTSTVNLIVTIIQGSFKMAYLLGILKEYSMDKIKRPRLKQKSVSCFSKTDQRKIEQEIMHSKKDNMFGIVLCLYTGLRIGELLALTWDDIDFQGGTISVSKTCSGERSESGFYQAVNEPKTESSNRTIPVPKQLLHMLKGMKTRGKCQYVISTNGRPQSLRSYQRIFESLLKRLGISHRGFHALRHTFATRALECGMDVKTLSEILGHKNATVTLNRYAHSLPEHKANMMNRLGKLFLQ